MKVDAFTLTKVLFLFTATYRKLLHLTTLQGQEVHPTIRKHNSKNIPPHLNLPQGFAAGCRGSGLPPSCAEENVLLFSVVIAREELLLLRMK